MNSQITDYKCKSLVEWFDNFGYKFKIKSFDLNIIRGNYNSVNLVDWYDSILLKCSTFGKFQ